MTNETVLQWFSTLSPGDLFDLSIIGDILLFIALLIVSLIIALLPGPLRGARVIIAIIIIGIDIYYLWYIGVLVI